jgi:hypothetical protein
MALSPSLSDLLRCLSSLSHLSASCSYNLPEAQDYPIMGYRPPHSEYPQFNNRGNRTRVGYLLLNPLRKITDMYVLHNTFTFILGYPTWAAIYCQLTKIIWDCALFGGGTKIHSVPMAEQKKCRGVSNEKSAMFLSVTRWSKWLMMKQMTGCGIWLHL